MLMPQLTVARKLIVSFAAIGVVLVLLSALSIHALATAHQEYESFVNEDNVRAALGNDLLDAANARAIGARNLVLSTNAAELDADKAAVTAAHQKVQASLAALRKATKGTADIGAEEKRLLEVISIMGVRKVPPRQRSRSSATAPRRRSIEARQRGHEQRMPAAAGPGAADCQRGALAACTGGSLDGRTRRRPDEGSSRRRPAR